MIRVCLVDDQTLVRQGIRSLLALDDGIEVVAEAGDGRQAVELIPQVRPDVVLMDLSLPDGSGYDLLEHMAGNDDVGFPPVIVYTGRALSREEEQRLRRYSKSIIIKGARSPERLLDEVTLLDRKSVV